VAIKLFIDTGDIDENINIYFLFRISMLVFILKIHKNTRGLDSRVSLIGSDICVENLSM